MANQKLSFFVQDGMNIVDVLAIMPFFVTLFMAEPLDVETYVLSIILLIVITEIIITLIIYRNANLILLYCMTKSRKY